MANFHRLFAIGLSGLTFIGLSACSGVSGYDVVSNRAVYATKSHIAANDSIMAAFGCPNGAEKKRNERKSLNSDFRYDAEYGRANRSYGRGSGYNHASNAPEQIDIRTEVRGRVDVSC